MRRSTESPLRAKRLVTVTAPELMKPEAVAAAREQGVALIWGGAPRAYPERLRGVTDLRIVAESASRPAAIAEIAVFEAASGETVQPSLAAPLYVRNRVALTMAERAPPGSVSDAGELLPSAP